jgi:hypothetical protein
MPLARNQTAGFTLVEAVVAALVLLVAVVFVAQVFVTAIQQNKASRNYTHATAIAQSKLEELNAIPIEKLSYGGHLGPDVADGSGGDRDFKDFVRVDSLESDQIGVVEDKDDANYVRYWKIEPDPEGWAGMYRITVRAVALVAGQGARPEETTLSTIRSQY